MTSTIWWFRILVVATISTSTVFTRHMGNIPPVEGKKPQLANISQADIEDFITWLEERLHEEDEEEKELIEIAKAEKQRSEKLKEAMEKIPAKVNEMMMSHKEVRKDDITDSVDYMGDAPEISADTQKEKVLEVMAEANVTWALGQTNGSTEDPSVVKEQRERSKVLRISSIRDTIMELRKGNGPANGSFPPTKTLQEIFEYNFQPHVLSTSYTEKLQSFYPSCKTPNHTEEEVWNDSNFKILFNVTYPTPGVGTVIQVMAAKLRLYKQLQVNATSTTPSGRINGPSSKSAKVEKPSGSDDFVEDERLLRASVYWYTRALRKNRVKRKLLDSQMFTTSIGDVKFIELNIRTAVRYWRDSGKNHGLLVTVEDEDGAILPASKYLYEMNCSTEAACEKPLPSFVEDAAKQYMQQHPASAKQTMNGKNSGIELNPFPNCTYPKLDICTVEVPLTDIRQISEVSCNQKTPEQIQADLMRVRNETTQGPAVEKRQGNETRGTFFNMVRLGSPSPGQNRNALVPILTKSDVVTSPEDERMRNELARLQTEAPRMRHGRKHSSNARNETTV